MTFEEFIIQTKTLKQIAKFMNVSERQIASLEAELEVLAEIARKEEEKEGKFAVEED